MRVTRLRVKTILKNAFTNLSLCESQNCSEITRSQVYGRFRRKPIHLRSMDGSLMLYAMTTSVAVIVLIVEVTLSWLWNRHKWKEYVLNGEFILSQKYMKTPSSLTQSGTSSAVWNCSIDLRAAPLNMRQRIDTCSFLRDELTWRR